MRAKEILNEVKQRLDAKCWKGKHKEGTKIKGGVRVNNCVPNESLKEFALDDGSGGEEDTLLKYARIWYNGDDDTQQKVETILDRMGWEIGEVESEDGGAFVVQSGDEHGKSYISFSPQDLSEGLAEDWNKVNKKDKTDGMSQKAVNAYRRENPGSKLKTAVTTEPSKLKKGGKASKRRKSFCARSNGQKKMHNIDCSKTPDKAICKARARWNCESVEEIEQQLEEAALGTNPKRPARAGSRPPRGHKEEPRYQNSVSKDQEDQFHLKLDKLVHNTFGPSSDEVKEGKTVKKEAPKPRNFVAKNAINTGAGAHKDKKKADKQGDVKHKKNDMDLAEMEDLLEKASRKLCKSSKPDEDLGASNLASCKSQGLRARDGDKSHKLGKSAKSRVKVGGHRIKGQKYGGPLPDWS